MSVLPSTTNVLSFDCYGTLIDWESGIVSALQPWLGRAGLELDREDLLRRFGAIETVVETETPGLLYPAVLAKTMLRLADKAKVPATANEMEAFGASVPDWPAFPDSAKALTRLKTRYKLVILSNVDRASFAASAKKLGVEFDLVITAQDVGSYKPDHRNFDRLFADLSSIGEGRSALVHVAESLYHDHEPAETFGIPNVWIHRRFDKVGSGATHPPSGATSPRWQFASMAAFADAAVDSE